MGTSDFCRGALSRAALDAMRLVCVVCCYLISGGQAVSSFGTNLVVNGAASSNNFNGWTQTQSDNCQITTQNNVRMFTGPNDANVFNIKSCTIAQSIDIGFAAKYVSTQRAFMAVSGYFGANGNDYSTFTVQQRDAAGTTVATNTIGDVKGSFGTRTATDIVLHKRARTLYVAFKAQQGGLGLRCDAWGTLFSVFLTRRTWTTSASITPPPTPSATSVHASGSLSDTDAATQTAHTSSLSLTYDLTRSSTYSEASPTQSGSSDTSRSTSLSVSCTASPTDSINASRLSASVSHTPSGTTTWSNMRPSESASATLSKLSTTRSSSNIRPTESITATISAPSASKSHLQTQSTSTSNSVSPSERTASTSCGNPPPITIRIDGHTSSDASSGICQPNGITRITMPATDLLYHMYVEMAVEYVNELSVAWDVVAAVTGPGVAEGASTNVTKTKNASSSSPHSHGRASTWNIHVNAGRGGWRLISLSPYVTQRWAIVLTLSCAGMSETASYSIVVDALGAPLPFSTAAVVTSTFAQAVTQVASGTLVPASLSTMRALARLASCGTSDASADSSTGVVSVVAEAIERLPVAFVPDALDVVANLGLCLLVAAFLLTATTVVYCMLCGAVGFVELASRVHLPSILCPVAMFALPTALGNSVAILSQHVNADGSSDVSLAVGVVGVSVSGLFFVWLLLVGVVYGPRRVKACRSAQEKRGMRRGGVGRNPPQRLAAWCAGIVHFAMHRHVSWRPLSGGSNDDSKRNAWWKYAHHILFQDVRFFWVPVVEAACALAATISTAMVTVPGFGCQAAVVTIALVYVVQAVSFAILRPYTSPLTQYFSLSCNLLTVLATCALAVDIFEVEYKYSVRFSVAFQLLLMGLSSVKGFVDIVEFGEGIRGIMQWIFLTHEDRMDRMLMESTLKIHDDEADDDDDNVLGAMQPLNQDNGMRSISSIELNSYAPLTPLDGSTAKFDGHSQRGSQLPHLPSNGSMTSSAPETVAGDRPTSPQVPPLQSSGEPLQNSFSLHFPTDDEEIHRRWWERHRRNERPSSTTAVQKRSGFTMFMVDEAAVAFEDCTAEPVTPRVALEVDDPF